MGEMSDYKYAQEFRNVVRRITRKVIREEVPSIKMGKVYSVDSVRQLAWILFPNETIDNIVKVNCAADKIPTLTMDMTFEELGYDAPGDIVRVWGKPGSLFILDYYSGLPAAQSVFITSFTDPVVNFEHLILSGARMLMTETQGAGAGGGSARRGANGSVRCGGGGGSGGNRSIRWINLEELDLASVFITVGTGGDGGAAITVNDTDGIDGASGGLSAVRSGTSGVDPSVSLCVAIGGRGGFAGTEFEGLGGEAVINGMWIGGDGGTATSNGGEGRGGSNSAGAGAGGGSGAGLTSGNIDAAGGQGGISGGGVSVGVDGGLEGGFDGNPGADNGILSPGQAGAGGGSNSSGSGGDGGAGARGAGGGGGGASPNGSASGAGGRGGDGFVIATAYY
jgi:hypothetical protein